jgi:hypothetical protein
MKTAGGRHAVVNNATVIQMFRSIAAVMLFRARNESLSNVWNFSVKSEAIASR